MQTEQPQKLTKEQEEELTKDWEELTNDFKILTDKWNAKVEASSYKYMPGRAALNAYTGMFFANDSISISALDTTVTKKAHEGLNRKLMFEVMRMFTKSDDSSDSDSD